MYIFLVQFYETEVLWIKKKIELELFALFCWIYVIIYLHLHPLICLQVSFMGYVWLLHELCLPSQL